MHQNEPLKQRLPAASSVPVSCLIIAFSAAFLQVQLALSPALTGCLPCSDSYLITAEHLWNRQSVFIKQIQRGWRLSAPASLELVALHTFQGSPQAQGNFPSRTPGLGGLGWDRAEEANIRRCWGPTSDGLVAKGKLVELLCEVEVVSWCLCVC